MIKLIASDLDGTLLQNNAQALNPVVFDLIRKLQEKGVHFVAASGRQYANLRRLFEPVKDEISYICENGSLCIHNGEVISKGLIERELGIRILKEIKKLPGCDVILSCEDACYMDSRNPRFIEHMTNVLVNDTKIVDDLTTVPHEFLKIAICDFDHMDDSFKHLKSIFDSEIKFVTSGNIWSDFIAPDANKGIALQKLLEKLSIKPEECVAFGDQYNDIEMLELAGTSYAMSGAAPGVSHFATDITDSVEETLKDILDGLS